MKKLLSSVLIASIFSIGCASKTPFQPAAELSSEKNKAYVWVYWTKVGNQNPKNSFVGALNKLAEVSSTQVFINNERVAEGQLNLGTHALLALNPRRVTIGFRNYNPLIPLALIGGPKQPVTLNLQAGKQYYIAYIRYPNPGGLYVDLGKYGTYSETPDDTEFSRIEYGESYDLTNGPREFVYVEK